MTTALAKQNMRASGRVNVQSASPAASSPAAQAIRFTPIPAAIQAKRIFGMAPSPASIDLNKVSIWPVK